MLYFDDPCISFIHKIFDNHKYTTYVNTLCAKLLDLYIPLIYTTEFWKPGLTNVHILGDFKVTQYVHFKVTQYVHIHHVLPCAQCLCTW